LGSNSSVVDAIKVSIVTPVYNAEKYLAQAIESVLAQTHSNWELLLTDDCSTDSSATICKTFSEQDARIKCNELEANSGSGVARNLSIELAAGEVIAFLDADDLWDSDFLEKSLQHMKKKQAGIVFSSYRRVTEDLSESLGEFIVPKWTNYHNMLKSCSISCLTGMYHVERCKGKAYMPVIRKRQDYCLWLTLLKRIDLAYGCRDVLATYRICSDSVSRNKIEAAKYQWYVYREVEGLALLTSCYYFVNYFIKGFIKNYSLLAIRKN